MSRNTAQIADAGFRTAFGTAPQGVWTAPGRVSLMGDHTDIEDGLSFAYTYQERSAVAVRLRDDDRVLVRTDLIDDVVDTELDAIEPPEENSWRDYPLGMIWTVLAHLRATDGAHGDGLGDGDAGDDSGEAASAITPTGMEIFLTTDVPIGGGLGSSASICGALALALNDLWGLELSRTELARLGYRVENEYVGASSGIADHITVLCGAEGRDVFYDARGGDVSLIELPPLSDHGLVSVLIQTREVHRNWAAIVAERHAACDRVAVALGYRYLREVPPEEFAAAASRIDPSDYRRARHIVDEIQRVLDLTRVLRTEGPAHIGPLLNASQRSLAENFEATTPRIDATCEVALGSGALGARMSGAGFGGTVYAIVPEQKTEGLFDAVRARYAASGWEEPVLLISESSPGAQREHLPLEA